MLGLARRENHAYALRADGAVDENEGEGGSRTYMNLGAGLNCPRERDRSSIANLAAADEATMSSLTSSRVAISKAFTEA
jgi:hypothetical protein